MKKIGILTDTSSGFNIEESKKLGIELILMPIIVNGVEYADTETINNKILFDLVSKNLKPKTSQPSYGVLKNKFQEMLKDYEYVIYIPLSSGLSSTASTAQQIASEFNNKVFVLDSRKVSILQHEDVVFAKKLADACHDIDYVCQEIMKRKDKDFAIITPQNLTYLKLGGRISPVVAAIGNLIGIKPLIKFENGSLDEFAKARTFKKAHSLMVEAVKNADIKAETHNIVSLYTNDNEEAKAFYNLVKESFPNYNIIYAELPAIISAHTGPNTIGIGHSLKH